jgi:hypothetical protein
MNAWERDTPWRQGHVLPQEAVSLLLPDLTETVIVIVISHDCDIAQDPAVEPTVEVITGRPVREVDGNFTHAKNARRLHLTFSRGTKQLSVELEASRKTAIEKHQLRHFRPVETVQMTAAERTILQRWLAARYRRAAFPDEFEPLAEMRK